MKCIFLGVVALALVGDVRSQLAACPAVASGAVFQVTAAVPTIGCSGTPNPTDASTRATCFTNSSGTCFTDGPGSHSNNERCTITVLQDTWLTVPSNVAFDLENNWDSLRYNGTRFYTRASIEGVRVTAGTNITFFTDGSVINEGFTVCSSSSAAPTAPPPPPCPPVASGAAFRVTAAVPVLGCTGTPNPTDASPRATCFTNNSGLCFTDGPGIHGNNERCTMTALRTVYLTVPSNVAFDLENNWDYLRIGNTRYYTRASIEGVQVTAGTTISFFSDGSVINEGFTVCGSTTAPTPPPTAPCPAVASSAAFQVTAAVPTLGCGGTPNPTDTVGSGSTCFTNNSGMCFTDGPGAHSNNERCTIGVRRDVWLTVPSDVDFVLENNYDYLLYNGVRFYTRASIEGLRVTAGSSIAFYSDGSVTNQGFTVCARTTPPPQTACPAVASGAFMQVTAAVPTVGCTGTTNPTEFGVRATCYTNSSGSCVTDGPGLHSNNERCTISILRNGFLNVPSDADFQLENNWDYLLYNNTRYYTRAAIHGIPVTANSVLTFFSDGSVVNPGFTVCADTTQPCPAVVSTAAFQVVAANTLSCSGTPNPTDVVGSGSTCFTNSSGRCVTDGPGAHSNNERCTIQIRANGVLTVPSDADFSLENNFDYLLYNGTRYYTRASIEGLRVVAGTQMAFFSDGSVTNQGFTVCSNEPPCDPVDSNAAFQVAASVPLLSCTGTPNPTDDSSTCFTNNSGLCFTDGPGVHGNNERCTMSVLRDAWLTVPSDVDFSLERGWDYLLYNGVRYYTRAQIEGVRVTAGSNITYFTDGSVINPGFTVCASFTPPPTPPACPAVDSNAAFQVLASVPDIGCSGTPNPTDASARATCFTNSSGMCFTDGPGSHSNNERCTTAVLRDAWITVPSSVSFDLENNYDYLQIGATRYYTRASIEGVRVTAGTNISFFSDGSITNEGFTVCASFTPPPTPPACPAVDSGAAFQVTAAVPTLGCSGTPNPTDASARATCYTNNSGLCFTDGPGSHSNNERCTMTVLQTLTLTVPANVAFDLENNWDYLSIGTTRYYTRASIEGVQVTAGTNISFFSDGSVTNEGFTVCGILPTTAPSQPTTPPSLAPTAAPTTNMPTTSPTAGPVTPAPTPMPTPTPTPSPTAATPGSDPSTSSDSSGSTTIIIIIVVIVVVLLIGVLAFVMKGRGSSTVNNTDRQDKGSFENPIYSDTAGQSTSYEGMEDQSPSGEYLDVQ